MLRVIIADDEARICKLIQLLADWDGLGLEVVGVAENGPDAIALIGALRPDILITDIRMPGCDGLAVIREAKALLPALEVIIISGYAQFDYARTAIQYGVGEYLLKPINKNALNTALARMAEGCRARQAAAQDIAQLQASGAGDDLSRLREALVADLLEGRFTADTPDALTHAYHFGGGDGVYQFFLLKLDYDPALFTAPSLDVVHDKVRDLLGPLLSPLCDDYVLARAGSAVYGVLHHPAGMRETLRGRVREGLNQLIARQDLFGSIIFSMALSPLVPSPDGLPEAMRGVRAAIAERLVEGTGRLLEGAPDAAPADPSLLARYAHDVTLAIDLLNDEAARDAAITLEQSAVQGVRRGAALLSLSRDAGILFATRAGAEDRERVLEDFDARLAQCHTIAGLFACLRSLQDDLLAAARARVQGQAQEPIRRAKQYIQEHYAGPLTLEEVSAAIGFSVNYFSTLFKRETGEGFAHYLTRVRLDAAKGLLRETRLSVQEVCREVGYGDIKHFTRTFRQETGLTPGEYRRLYG